MARATKRLVICASNTGYEASLECRKIHVTLPDDCAGKLEQIRVIDESGENYLYDRDAFLEVILPQAVRRAVLMAA